MSPARSSRAIVSLALGPRRWRSEAACFSGGEVPCLPDELIYDDANIIYTPEFYQTHEEIALLQRYGSEIAKDQIAEGAVLINIGAGDLNKANYLLEELRRRGRKVTYLALDISKRSLTTNLCDYAPGDKGVSVYMAGLWGDFRAGVAFAATVTQKPRVFLSLGSVLFNDPWQKAVGSLRDLILAGMDGHDVHSSKVWAAYHSRPDLFEEFFHNGFLHANKLLGEDVFHPGDWDIRAEIETEEKRHRFFLQARRDIVSEVEGRIKKKGLAIDWFDADKRSEEDVRSMCAEAGLEVVQLWACKDSDMRQYLIGPGA
ncbi:Duf323 domain-containing protein [Colletotrichum higginsianum IMI 349063]|uniref:Duf323 domain-containing protein n=2 Tax=Colletotrichum higginsianum (strain IMI 349063) TaxID=759273 RepID=A0A1B7XQT2_COLHI|nr:Duf323 domain-containing protein [Colletotrichum higginsianum IMI 349063]OBR02111.1 Duf323 domain-containing protein [Colletotrichum higginsianum IMI 349063]